MRELASAHNHIFVLPEAALVRCPSTVFHCQYIHQITLNVNVTSAWNSSRREKSEVDTPEGVA
eukprot:8399488-Heterocapsa_arctica.AAC.1